MYRYSFYKLRNEKENVIDVLVNLVVSVSGSCSAFVALFVSITSAVVLRAAIEGGSLSVGLAELTGGAAERITLGADDAGAAEAVANGSLWARLLKYARSGFLLGASSPAGRDSDPPSPFGIVFGHAYSVLDVREESDGGGVHRLIRMRNPWGSTEWTGITIRWPWGWLPRVLRMRAAPDTSLLGDWCDTDKARWSKRMCTLLDHPDPSALPAGTANDGEFWISFEDFVRHFSGAQVQLLQLVANTRCASCDAGSGVHVCRLFTDVAEGGAWYAYEARSEWRGPSAGGAPKGAGCPWSDNPQLAVPIARSCTLFVVLQQSRPTHDAWYTNIYLLRKGGKRARTLPKSCVVASCDAFVNTPVVSFEVELESQGETLTLVPMTMDAGNECPFTVRIFCSFGLAVEGRSLSWFPRDSPAV